VHHTFGEEILIVVAVEVNLLLKWPSDWTEPQSAQLRVFEFAACADSGILASLPSVWATDFA
jgi:hypothetical protein